MAGPKDFAAEKYQPAWLKKTCPSLSHWARAASADCLWAWWFSRTQSRSFHSGRQNCSTWPAGCCWCGPKSCRFWRKNWKMSFKRWLLGLYLKFSNPIFWHFAFGYACQGHFAPRFGSEICLSRRPHSDSWTKQSYFQPTRSNMRRNHVPKCDLCWASAQHTGSRLSYLRPRSPASGTGSKCNVLFFRGNWICQWPWHFQTCTIQPARMWQYAGRAAEQPAKIIMSLRTP